MAQRDVVKGIMPFKDPRVEEGFLRSFHEQKRLLDVAMVVLGLIYAAYDYRDILFIASQVLALIIILKLPGYSAQREYIITAFRASPSYHLFFITRNKLSTVVAPTFLSGAFTVGYSIARFKLPLYFALLYPMPVRGLCITLQTFLVGLLLLQSPEECRIMEQDNPDLHVFASQLSLLYTLWREGAPGDACGFMCNDILHMETPGLGFKICQWLLPVAFRVYGEPWMQACIRHRYLVVILLGYILPLMGLYIWEMRDRLKYAHSKAMRTPRIYACLARGLAPFLCEIATNIAFAVFVFHAFCWLFVKMHSGQS